MLDLDRALESFDSLEARWDGRTRRLASVTFEVAIQDPVAALIQARRATDRWFAWEEPERGFAVAGIGTTAESVARGPGRFADVSADSSQILRNRLCDEPADLPAGAGPIWVGGFAFAPDGGAAPHWSSLPPASMFMPSISIVRESERSFATISVLLEPARDRSGEVRDAKARLSTVSESGMPLFDPAPAGQVEVASAKEPAAYERAVAAAVERIQTGRLDKVVLAREVRADAPGAHDPLALFGALRELFPSCYCFCVGTPEAAFIGASPELLVRRRGAGVQTVALAGSTRRSADPAVDDHLGEQLRTSAKNQEEHDIVVRRIKRALTRHAVWVEASEEPVLIKVANIQHLATPIHAQLSQPRSAIELAGMLHPTPAVGGEPSDLAERTIDELEGMDRGWYAAPVGWMDALEDGEFCVALRSALLRDRTAHLYAGAGIVADSDPEAELAETELKLAALLPLVSG